MNRADGGIDKVNWRVSPIYNSPQLIVTNIKKKTTAEIIQEIFHDFPRQLPPLFGKIVFPRSFFPQLGMPRRHRVQVVLHPGP